MEVGWVTGSCVNEWGIQCGTNTVEHFYVSQHMDTKGGTKRETLAKI
jgi:hypothetical protein